MTAARSIRSLLAALIISLILVAVSAQPARAAGQLSSTQINAVIGLLEAFDVPQSTIDTVKGVLQGTNTGTNTGTETGSNSGTSHQAAELKVVKVTSSIVKAKYEKMPAESIVRLVNATTGVRVESTGTFISAAGKGTFEMSLAGLAQGTYKLQAFDYYNQSAAARATSGTFKVEGSGAACSGASNSNSGRGSCEDEDEDESHDDDDDGDDSSEQVYTAPTVVVTYPKNSKGPYDITREGHFGTSMLIGWSNYKMPAGSYACSFLYNGSTGVSYPLPETNNCVNVGTSNQNSTTRGYARVPAGNKYQAKVVAYKADGTVLAQGLSHAVFSMQVMDRNSQERQVSRDITSTDSAGKITFGGSATISKIYITMMKDLATVYNSPAITVSSGRWSHTTTRTFTQGTYSVAILNEAGDVLDSGFVYLNPSKPSDSTGGTSVTEPTLTVTTSAGSLWVSIQGSTGQGCDGKTYTLDYGDGVSANIPIGIGSCQPIFTRSYPYKTAGTYTIKVLPPTSCPATAVCASPTPVITKTVTVPGSTSMVPVSELTAALPYLPISFYETMSKVTDALAAVEMAPVYVLVDAFSEFLFQAGLY